MPSDKTIGGGDDSFNTFSRKPVPASTSRVPYSAISSRAWSTKSELVPTDSSSTLNSSSPVKRMPPTTTPAATTPSVRNSSTLCSTEYESSPTSAPVSKASSFSARLVAAPDLDSLRYWLSDSQSTMEKRANSSLLYTRRRRSVPLWSSLTTQC